MKKFDRTKYTIKRAIDRLKDKPDENEHLAFKVGYLEQKIKGVIKELASLI